MHRPLARSRGLTPASFTRVICPSLLFFWVTTDFSVGVPWHFPVHPSEVVASSSPAVPESLDDTPLTAEQEAAVDLASRGSNVFLTGPGGTGKSVTISRIYAERCQAFQSQAQGGLVGKTSTTGSSAVACGGVTLDSFTGLRPGISTVEQLQDHVFSKRHIKHRWASVRCLIIDEASMLSCHKFDLLEQFARRVRGNNQFFGGIQLILTGDFLQVRASPTRDTHFDTSTHAVTGSCRPSPSPIGNRIHPSSAFSPATGRLPFPLNAAFSCGTCTGSQNFPLSTSLAMFVLAS